MSLALAGLLLLGLFNALGLWVHWLVYQANCEAARSMRNDRNQVERIMGLFASRPRLHLVQTEPRNERH